jgi:hypothetical protein
LLPVELLQPYWPVLQESPVQHGETAQLVTSPHPYVHVRLQIPQLPLTVPFTQVPPQHIWPQPPQAVPLAALLQLVWFTPELQIWHELAGFGAPFA